MKTVCCAKSLNRPPARLAGNFLLLSLGVLLAGCPAGKQTDGTDKPAPPAAGDKVIIRGSNTIGEELAPRLIEEFKKDHPAVTFDLEAKATGYGLAALRAGQCDVAAASRAPIREELDLTSAAGVELNEHLLGAYSVAVVLNANNPVANLTKEQVRGIFTGKIQNWKDVGGPDAAIHLYIRDPISGTHLGFKEIAMNNDPYAPNPNLLTNYTGIVEAVAGDTGGIGYAGIEMAATPRTKAASIEGVEAAASSVNSGKYPYARVLRLYTSKGRESRPAMEFIRFVLSPRGQEIVARSGFTPKP
jgi:phosphate transport system substrate-binding protein